MRACGLIVEYNPFHNGHQFHLEKSKIKSESDCMIAVMSGNFLQRGEPAIIDKFHRARIAIQQGVDIVVELPFAYAVQHSDLFAKGAILTLGAMGVEAICFGSEHGETDNFTKAVHTYLSEQETYKEALKDALSNGLSFPQASTEAYKKIGLTEGQIDLSKPNNILGFSYVKSIVETNQKIKPYTIKRYKNNYHDKSIRDPIASATSIREALFSDNDLPMLNQTMPNETIQTLAHYRREAGIWHQWETYFPLIQYRVMTMTAKELSSIHGIGEGLENRLKKTATKATSFQSWVEAIKTKRYTWTRIQRVMTHILVNSKKETIQHITESHSISHIRLLGMSRRGQEYLNRIKKHIHVPIVTSLGKDSSLLEMDERAADAYYSVLAPQQRIKLRSQEIKAPYMGR
ncbi:nucleotidyltransferase [Aquibacillus kalidii]|uniref:nucleotidyltransferase n=1 Tax=Aquibacillus kalidii TaxID=2762597 RepID=UPI001646570D|nr:nucleotidyltransferase [Aquibacillus kalidii]